MVVEVRIPVKGIEEKSDDDIQQQIRLAASSFESTGSQSTPTMREPVAPEKKGYLYKWQDRSIGWSGTQWALRFVHLEGGRISYYRSHTDNFPRYVLTLRGCAIQDEGYKRNRKHVNKMGLHSIPSIDEPGAYFHYFSVYQRPQVSVLADSGSSNSSAVDIVPLLRFSTTSIAEKTFWVHVIAEACAYCETEKFLAEETARLAEQHRRREEAIAMESAMPQSKKGTLPPLYFAPAPTLESSTRGLKPLQRRPSGTSNMPKSKLFRSKSGGQLADDDLSKTAYPQSKPMHRSSEPSYLSEEAPTQNYRGFFNLAVLVLLISHCRILLTETRTHGFFLWRLMGHLEELSKFNQETWADFPVFSGLLTVQTSIVLCFVTEWLLGKKKLMESVGMAIHNINIHGSLALSSFIIWNYIDNPFFGAAVMLQALITWMKLISYAYANEDYRRSSMVSDVTDSCRATTVIVEDLDPLEHELKYPRNITLGNIYYFWFAPTLTYQIAFPRSPGVNYWRVFGLSVRMVLCVALFSSIVVQGISPALDNLVHDLKQTRGIYTAPILLEYGLQICLGNTYLWILMFYSFFHLFLNLLAELLRFGDRVFYKDWWNCSDVSSYWRLWNMPVHYWLVRHFYFPALRLTKSKSHAMMLVFFFSAVLHEYLISLPFHMVRPWSFLGMMGQMPLMVLTKNVRRRFPKIGSTLGNLIFWLSFCVVGQPMAIMLYTIDYQYGVQGGPKVEIEHCLLKIGGTCYINQIYK